MERRYFVAVAVATVLAVVSCTKEGKSPEPAPKPSGSVEMKFSVQGDCVDRAAVDGIRIVGLLEDGTLRLNEAAALQESVYVPANGPHYYLKNYGIDMYSVCPSSVVVDVDGGLSFPASSGDVDVCVALTKGANSVSVPTVLSFGRIFSQLEISVKGGAGESVNVVLEKVRLRYPLSGTFSLKEMKWGEVAESSWRTVYEGLEVVPTDSFKELSFTETVVPQSVTVDVSWTTVTKHSGKTVDKLERSFDVTLSRGRRNVIMVILPLSGDKEIEHTVGVQDWKTKN